MWGLGSPEWGLPLWLQDPTGALHIPWTPTSAALLAHLSKNAVPVSRVLTGPWRRQGSPSSGVALAGLLQTPYSGAQLLVRRVSHTRFLQDMASSSIWLTQMVFPVPSSC